MEKTRECRGGENSQLPFLGGVIHQFRNWLGGIIGHSDLALLSNDPAEMRSSLTIAMDLSEKSAELLLALSKYRNESPGKIGPCDLADIGRDVGLLTDNWLKEKGYDVSQELETAPALNIDIPLTRITLVEKLFFLQQKTSAGGTLIIGSGISSNRPFIKLESRSRRSGPGDESGSDKIELPGLQYLVEHIDTGGIRMTFTAIGETYG